MPQAKQKVSRASSLLGRPFPSVKKILWLGDSQQKTRSDPSGSVGPKSASSAPSPQPQSETASLRPSSEDSLPIHIPDNQNSSGIDNSQVPLNPTSDATSQSPLEQPSRRLLEQDKQGPPLL